MRARASPPAGGAVGRPRWEGPPGGGAAGARGRVGVERLAGRARAGANRLQPGECPPEGRRARPGPTAVPMSLITSQVGSPGTLRRGRHLGAPGCPAPRGFGLHSWEGGRWTGRVAPERARKLQQPLGEARRLRSLAAGPLAFPPRPGLARGWQCHVASPSSVRSPSDSLEKLLLIRGCLHAAFRPLFESARPAITPGF